MAEWPAMKKTELAEVQAQVKMVLKYPGIYQPLLGNDVFGELGRF